MADDDEVQIRHPIFGRLFPLCAQLMERDAGPLRDELLAGLGGRVLEIGAGSGMNFAHYPAAVREVVATEPEPHLRAKAKAGAGRAAVPVQVVAARAETLPFDATSFDAAVCSLVLCSVADVAAALAELHRVLRPGAELRLFEHVRAAEPGKARVQRAFDRSGVWPFVAGGCHCGRDTRAAVEAGGFELGALRHVTVGPAWGITNPHLLGVARRAA